MRKQQQEDATRRETRLLLEQRLANKKYEDDKKLAKHRAKEYQCWLQTKFPAELAVRCITNFQSLIRQKKKLLQENVWGRNQSGEFEAFRVVPERWRCDDTLTAHWCNTKCVYGGSAKNSVRCGTPFLHIIEQYAPQGKHTKVPQAMLMTLFEKCVPHARKIFAGNYDPMKLLHLNDYVIEKTFVHAMMILSKFLGDVWFKWGVFKWPPPAPPNVYAPNPDIAPAPDVALMPSAASSSGLSEHLGPSSTPK